MIYILLIQIFSYFGICFHMKLWQIILYTVYILILILMNTYALNGNRDQPSNTVWNNGVSLGWGYLFVKPMADGGVFRKPVWFEPSFFLVWCRKHCGNYTYLFLWFNFCVILTTISINLTDWTKIYNNNNIIISYLYERERERESDCID